MSARWNGGHYEGRTWTVILANVESVSGGSMRIAPGAKPDDGLLWVTVIETGPKLKMILKVLPKVAAGRHLNEKGVHHFSTKQIELTSETPAIIDVDGETLGSGTGASIRLVPGAIRIVAPAGAA
jgi:diacylglycerol kinase (ATP)